MKTQVNQMTLPASQLANVKGEFCTQAKRKYLIYPSFAYESNLITRLAENE